MSGARPRLLVSSGTGSAPFVSMMRSPRRTNDARRVETIVGSVCDELQLARSNTVVYICGNPAMQASVEALLGARGFTKDQMKKEVY